MNNQLLEKIKIIFENNDFLAINKPAGVLVHPVSGSSEEKTLKNWIIQKYPEIKKVGEDLSRPGIVHRLDRDTSGIMLIAKNQKAYLYFKDLFKNRKIKKAYLALVYGKIKEKNWIINKPIGRIKTGVKRSSLAKKMSGLKEAITEYKLKNFFQDKRGDNFSLLEVYPKTGRTNQIRVHLQSVGHPIAGDKIYSSKKSVLPDRLERMFLHAYSLEFLDPDGRAMKVEADLPENLKRVLRNLIPLF